MKKVTGDELIKYIYANKWTIFSDESDEIVFCSDKKGNVKGATIDPDTGDPHAYLDIESLVYEDSQNGILYYWIYDKKDIYSLKDRLLKYISFCR